MGRGRDYELEARIEADTPARLKALADPTRSLVVDLVLERAMSVTELAARIDKPKGTIAHHVDVLVDAGLVKVVRTRRVRALEERFYGRVARTIVFPDLDDGDDEIGFLTAARAEVDVDRLRRDGVGLFTLRHARIPAARAREFSDRVDALAAEFADIERGGDVEYAFLAGVFPTNRSVQPPRVASPKQSSRKAG